MTPIVPKGLAKIGIKKLKVVHKKTSKVLWNCKTAILSTPYTIVIGNNLFTFGFLLWKSCKLFRYFYFSSWKLKSHYWQISWVFLLCTEMLPHVETKITEFLSNSRFLLQKIHNSLNAYQIRIWRQKVLILAMYQI